MRISGNELSSVIFSQTKQFQKCEKSDAPNEPNQHNILTSMVFNQPNLQTYSALVIWGRLMGIDRKKSKPNQQAWHSYTLPKQKLKGSYKLVHTRKNKIDKCVFVFLVQLSTENNYS